MSGTNNPYDLAEMYKKWARQNEQLQEEFQKNFERVNEQISKIPETVRQFAPQPDRNVNPMGEGAQQIAEMVKNVMATWQFPKTARYDSMFNMMLNWAAFKTSIGSNGRISIPEAERSALDIGEGDLVQVIVLPVKKKEVNK